MGAAETARLLSTLDLDDSRFQRGVARSLGSLGKLDQGFGRVGKGAGQLGGGLLKVGAVAAGAAVAGLGLAAKKAIDMDDAFASVRKNVEGGTATLDKLNDQLHQMATRIPVKYTDLAAIAAEAGALGVQAPSVAKFTETVARLSASTQGLTVEAAAEAFGKFRNTLQLSDTQLTNAASALIALGKAGASSEGDIIEIGKRFAAAGHQAGLSAADVLGFSSAIASLGVEPEAAGSSLSRLFNNITKYIGTGDDKIAAFAKTSGLSVKAFSKLFGKDAKGAVLDFLQGLSKLDKFKASAVLKDAGITNVRDINAVLLLSQNYKELQRQLGLSETAFKENTELADTSNKRFDTLSNKIKILGQNLQEAGYQIAQGFLPALGRKVEEFTKFLQDQGNIAQLKSIGQDIGKAIDKIDLNKLLSAAQGLAKALDPALQILLKIADLISGLPPQVIGGAAGLLVANKVSGGAIGSGIGNIIGGIGQALAGSLAKAGVGRLFVQPVFVTNPGFGGALGGALGGGAGGGGIGLLGKLGLLAIGVTGLADVIATQQQVSNDNSQHASDVLAQLQKNLNDPKFDVRAALNGVEDGINKLQANPLLVLVQGDALDQLKQMRELLLKGVGAPGAPGSAVYGPPAPKPGTAGSPYYGPPVPKAPGAPGSPYYGPPAPTKINVTVKDPAVIAALNALRNRLVSISEREGRALRDGNKGWFGKLIDREHELVRKGAKQGDLTLWLGSLNRREALATRTHNGEWLGKLERKESEIKDRVTAAAERGARATTSGTSGTTAAVNVARSGIVNAITGFRIPAPIVNVTTNITATGVQSATTTSNRYGPGTSKDGNNNDVHPGTP